MKTFKNVYISIIPSIDVSLKDKRRKERIFKLIMLDMYQESIVSIAS